MGFHWFNNCVRSRVSASKCTTGRVPLTVFPKLSRILRYLFPGWISIAKTFKRSFWCKLNSLYPYKSPEWGQKYVNLRFVTNGCPRILATVWSILDGQLKPMFDLCQKIVLELYKNSNDDLIRRNNLYHYRLKKPRGAPEKSLCVSPHCHILDLSKISKFFKNEKKYQTTP